MIKTYKLKVSTADLKYCGAEPEWANTVITDDNRQLLTIKAFNWYNYVCTGDERRHFVQDWIKHHQLNPTLITAVDRAAERDISSTAAWLARMSIMGYPLSPTQRQMIDQMLERVQGIKNPAAATSLLTPKSAVSSSSGKNPADRRAKLIDAALDMVDDAVTDCLYSGRSGIKPEQVIKAAGSSRATVQAVANLTEIKLAQFTELLKERSGPRPGQISEAYSRVTDAHARLTVKWLTQLLALTAQLLATATRTRRIKPVDPVKQVSKLVYLKSHDQLKLTSIDPRKCIDADEVWTYCVRTRKITVYRPVANQKLTVKGAQLINVDPVSSSQKTLRKPQTQLVQFAQTNSKKLGSWLEGVNTTAHRPKPRLNAHTIILKAVSKP